MKTTFIYALNDPNTGECRYVGKADDPHDRLFGNCGHLYEARTTKSPNHRTNWIKTLLNCGLVPLLEILQEVSHAEWKLWERAWIKASREIGMDLVNGTDGGDGTTWWLGKKHSPEHCAAIGAAQRGKKLSLEHCAAISAARLGKKRSQEHCAASGAASGAARLGKRFSPERCAAIRAAKFGKKYITNASGFVGCYCKGEKWEASFTVRQKLIYVGRFSKIEDAVFARALAIANQ